MVLGDCNYPKNKKPGLTYPGFSQIFIELCSFQVQLARPEGNLSNGYANLKSIYSATTLQQHNINKRLGDFV